MHTSSGRWRLGLMLALTTAIFWGALPIALKIMLAKLDPYTLSWYRFFAAAIIMSIYLSAFSDFSAFKNLRQKSLLILVCIAVIGLTSNYLLYIVGLNKLDPGTAQVVIQLAPMFLLLGGLFIFKESFNHLQWTGFIILIAGLLIFFNYRLVELISSLNNYTLGVIFIVLAAITWSAYALAQKELLTQFSSNDIMWLIYLTGGIVFIPMSEPLAIQSLTNQEIYILIFCALNTLIAYGSFAEALNHWEASKVSAILSITPILTVVMMLITDHFYPGVIETPNLNLWNYTGAFLVVFGSVLCSLSKSSELTT